MMSKLMSINIIYNKELHTKTSVICTDHMIKIKQMLGPRIRSLLFQQLNFLYCLNTCTLMGTSWQISESKTGYSVILKIKHIVWMKVQDYMTRNL